MAKLLSSSLIEVTGNQDELNLIAREQDELGRITESNSSLMEMDLTVARTVEFLYLNIFCGSDPVFEMVDEAEGSKWMAVMSLVRFLAASKLVAEQEDFASGKRSVIASQLLVRKSDWLFDEALIGRRIKYILKLRQKAISFFEPHALNSDRPTSSSLH